MKPIVAGYDGSDFAMQALDWAMDEAELRKTPLLLTHTWQWPYGEADDEAKSHLRKAAEHVLWHGAECARNTSAITDVDTDLFEGHPAQHLIDLSADAAMIVVGSRGLGRLPTRVLGSVAEHVAAHAACPVIVVRGPGPLPASTRPGPVKVEDDGGAVLEFAFHEAELRGLPVTGAPPALWAERYPGVELVEEQEAGPSLLVVGRKHARHTLHRAACPVAVVPE
ncbi:universal stress protein [Nonomuraea sediminis]|uniref:universal stress protein n=1 Tax=Nonomuraea sediminis TaxID=2835864 RepID=UPI001BDCF994|nr:universal stress protein [Nonomuraea sediminis]